MTGCGKLGLTAEVAVILLCIKARENPADIRVIAQNAVNLAGLAYLKTTANAGYASMTAEIFPPLT